MVVSIIPERIVGENEYNKQRGSLSISFGKPSKKNSGKTHKAFSFVV
jgi:hypothetical protein